MTDTITGYSVIKFLHRYSITSNKNNLFFKSYINIATESSDSSLDDTTVPIYDVPDFIKTEVIYNITKRERSNVSRTSDGGIKHDAISSSTFYVIPDCSIFTQLDGGIHFIDLLKNPYFDISKDIYIPTSISVYTGHDEFDYSTPLADQYIRYNQYSIEQISNNLPVCYGTDIVLKKLTISSGNDSFTYDISEIIDDFYKRYRIDDIRKMSYYEKIKNFFTNTAYLSESILECSYIVPRKDSQLITFIEFKHRTKVRYIPKELISLNSGLQIIEYFSGKFTYV